jgi:hypothetical protein
VTLYEHADFTGWEADFGPGEYDHARLSEMGAQNDDCESVVVGKGCYAVVAEHVRALCAPYSAGGPSRPNTVHCTRENTKGGK